MKRETHLIINISTGKTQEKMHIAYVHLHACVNIRGGP